MVIYTLLPGKTSLQLRKPKHAHIALDGNSIIMHRMRMSVLVMIKLEENSGIPHKQNRRYTRNTLPDSVRLCQWVL